MFSKRFRLLHSSKAASPATLSPTTCFWHIMFDLCMTSDYMALPPGITLVRPCQWKWSGLDTRRLDDDIVVFCAFRYQSFDTNRRYETASLDPWEDIQSLRLRWISSSHMVSITFFVSIASSVNQIFVVRSTGSRFLVQILLFSSQSTSSHQL